MGKVETEAISIKRSTGKEEEWRKAEDRTSSLTFLGSSLTLKIVFCLCKEMGAEGVYIGKGKYMHQQMHCCYLNRADQTG